MRRLIAIAFATAFGLTGWAQAAEPANTPLPTPLTRPTMKQMLEDLKQRTPRIPLPPLTDEEKAKLGERGGGYESRIRALYMPEGSSASRGGFSTGGKDDPENTLDYRFKVELFWIVSRTNNCQY